MSYNDPVPMKRVAAITSVALGCVLVVGGLGVGGYAVAKSVGRTQARADAQNRVRVSTIEIRNQEQRVEIAKQQAEIRLQDAIGVREAQDEIAKTLTPLYVQFEMVDAMRKIAESGRNNTVAFIPAGANGIPLVYDAANATKVGLPQEGK